MFGKENKRRDDVQALELLRLEYSSLRQESADARTSQQTTIAWSLAAFGAVFGAGLLFVSAELKKETWSSPEALYFYAVVFGVAVPGLAFAACLTYMGELRRMERVGGYLRGLEVEIQSWGLVPKAPLRWETYLRWGEDATGPAKQRLAYVGGVAIYTIVEIVSLAAFLIGLAGTTAHGHVLLPQAAISTIAYCYPAAVFLAFLTVNIVLGVKLIRDGSQIATYGNIRSGP